MKREELKAYEGESIYSVLECTPHNNDELHLEEIFNEKEEFKFYEKSEADKVFDDYEQRIKEFESQLENVQNAMYAENVDANMALVKAQAHIKELEAENNTLKADIEVLNDDCRIAKENEVKYHKAYLNELDENSRLKAQVPKWHSEMNLDLERPRDKQLVVIYDGERIGTAKVERIITNDNDFDIYHNRVGIQQPTHWMPLPPPPTEESSVTEK